MLSRRIVVHGLAALTAGLAWRPAWAGSRGAAPSVPTAVSPDMVRLADGWEASGQMYDATKHRMFLAMLARGQAIDIENPDYVTWVKAERQLVHASAEVLHEPARSEGDVIFKYHVIDMHHGWRAVGNWIWGKAGEWELYEGVRREAEHFGVAINPFWYKTPSTFAAIDGDQNSPRWALIARWRQHGAPTSIYQAHMLAERGERDRRVLPVAHRNI